MNARALLRWCLGTTLSLVASSALSCGPGGGGALTDEGPFLVSTAARTRQITITAERAHPAAGVALTCTLRADLFDPTTPRTLDVLASEGECRLYSSATDLSVGSQQHVCAGAIFVDYGGAAENLVVCPAERPVAPTGAQGPIRCEGLAAGARLVVHSEAEADTDVVTDLSATLNLPNEVRLREPTSLDVATWPAAGDLAVRWTGGNATSAVVTLTPRDPSASAPLPFIVCLPRTDGSVTVPASLLQQANMRTRDALLRVASYRDIRTTAEAGQTYRISAGIAASALLQGLR